MEQSLALVDAAIDKHFSPDFKKNQAEAELFNLFSNDLNALLAEHEEINNDDDTKKHIISKITDRIYHRDNRSHKHVTKSLLKYDSSYEKIYDNITEAFDPNGNVQDQWYANATHYCSAQYTNKIQYGHNGGCMPPLSLAIKKADHNWCGRLIAEGADVNKTYQSLYGITSALFEVIFCKNKFKREKESFAEQYKKQKLSWHIILSLLLKNKADISLGLTEWDKHITPYRYAIASRDEESTLTLRQYGATIDNESLKEKEIKWLERITQ